MSDASLIDTSLKRLDEEDKYRQILESIGDENVRSHVDATVRAFITQLAGGLEKVRESMGDDAVRAKMQELIKGATRGR